MWVKCYATETDNEKRGDFSHKARVLSNRSVASASGFFEKIVIFSCSRDSQDLKPWFWQIGVVRPLGPPGWGGRISCLRDVFYSEEAISTIRSRIFASGSRPIPPRMLSSRWRGLRSEEHTSELQSRRDLVCRLLLEK